MLKPLALTLMTAMTMPAIAQSMLTLSENASMVVTRDELTVRFFVEKSGENIGDLNRAVFAELDKALSFSSQEARVTSAGLGTYPTYNKDGKLGGWRVRATVELKGTNMALISRRANSLSEFMAFESMNFTLSAGTRKTAQDSLLAEVSTRFKAKAREAAKALGFAGIRIHQVSLDSAHADLPMPVPRVAAMAMPAEGLDFAGMASRETVSTTLTGTVEMLDRP